MRTSAVLSPRATPAELEDLAEKSRLIGRQRVARHRRRRPAASPGRRVAGRLGQLAAGGAILGAAALATGWFMTSPWFAVAEVQVSGQSRLSQEDLQAAAGIVPGENLFRLDVGAVVARLEAVPGVRRAEVLRRLPDRVTLVIEERRPFTLAHAGELHWIDEHGVDLGREARAVAVNAPVITGLDPEDLAPARNGTSRRAATGAALARLLLRSGGGLLRQISEIDVSRPDAPVLYTVGGIEVRLGGDDWEARLGRLQGVLAQLEASGEAVASIDLRFRDQVVLNTAVR